MRLHPTVRCSGQLPRTLLESRCPAGHRREDSGRDETHARTSFSRETRADAKVPSWCETGSQRKLCCRFRLSVAAASCPCETAALRPVTGCARRPQHQTSSGAGDGPPNRRCHSVPAECNAREAVASGSFYVRNSTGPLHERPFCVAPRGTARLSKRSEQSVPCVKRELRCCAVVLLAALRVNQPTCQPTARPPCTSEWYESPTWRMCSGDVLAVRAA